ncbi:hypothetical protein [Pseudactinotalea terrae]|uniref:hypothetical protein n=1 Tax=Pseudactinotalea terrae TaxID=1743262 RepID=UPI0012E28294|nr:hypothetical protein [Pseudactinotalea terrae]
MSTFEDTVRRTRAGVSGGGQFATKPRSESGVALPAPDQPPALTRTQRDALRALSQHGRQWPAGRGRYAGERGPHARFSARVLASLAEAGAACQVISRPGWSVVPFYEPTIVASYDEESAIWVVAAPDVVAHEDYVAAAVHGRRQGQTRSGTYRPERLQIERGDSLEGVTTFAVTVQG